MSRVNLEQNAAFVTARPPPPSSPPPPPPTCVGSSRAGKTLDVPSLPPPPLVPELLRAEICFTKSPTARRSLGDDSTTWSSSDGGESSEDSFPPWSGGDASSPLPNALFENAPNEAVVTRDVMLYHRSLCLRGLPVFSEGPLEATSKGLHSAAVATVPDAPDFIPPPGLSLPAKPANFAPPPGLEPPACTAKAPPPAYSPPAFRRELMAIFKELAADRNVARAVRRVRGQGVPLDRQAAEVADVITYVLEESRGPARRLFVAFVAGLATAFEKVECAAGLKLFFNTVYPELHDEVPKLSKLVNVELLPTLRTVFSAKEMRSFLPAEMSVPVGPA